LFALLTLYAYSIASLFFPLFVGVCVMLVVWLICLFLLLVWHLLCFGGGLVQMIYFTSLVGPF